MYLSKNTFEDMHEIARREVAADEQARRDARLAKKRESNRRRRERERDQRQNERLYADSIWSEPTAKLQWTPDLIDMLKALWAEGLSAAEIAFRIGRAARQKISRNAVIGKLHRLGISNRNRTVGFGVRSSETIKAERISAARRSTASRVKRVGGGGLLPVVAETGKVLKLLDQRVDPFVEPAPDRAPLIASVQDLERHHCRWPIGMPGQPGFGFCGCEKAEGSSYCAEHAARAVSNRAMAPLHINAGRVVRIGVTKLISAEEFTAP